VVVSADSHCAGKSSRYFSKCREEVGMTRLPESPVWASSKCKGASCMLVVKRCDSAGSIELLC
jgi:hypothetical protein